MPVGLTMSVGLPPTFTWPVMFSSAGPWCATECAYTGASRHSTTMTRNTPPKNNATLLRRKRRAASFQGPKPGGSSMPSPISVSARSVENSVPGAEVVAIAIKARGGLADRVVPEPTPGELLQRQRAEIPPVQGVEHVVRCHLVRHEGRERRV